MACPITIYSAAHGLSDNAAVTISGVEGLTDANGDFYVTDADVDSFHIALAPDVAYGAGDYGDDPYGGEAVPVTSTMTYRQGGEVTGVASASVTGLDHLEGETVAVLGDGAMFAGDVVSSGAITLADTVGTAHAGLPYTYRLEPMRMDRQTGGGTSFGSLKKVAELVLSFHESLGVRYGDGVDTYDINWRSGEDYTSAPALFTGERVVVFDGGFSKDDTIILSGSDPYPATVRAIVARTNRTGR